MSDSLSAAQPPVRVQGGKLSGLCYENTVIDRKGRIRKVKPPTAKKPDFGPAPHQKLDDHHHHHRPSVPQKNFDRSPEARLEDIFDNRDFVIGNNNVDYTTHPQQQQQQQQQLFDVDMRHRKQIWCRERPSSSSKSVSNTRNSYDDDTPQVAPNRQEKPQMKTKHSRSQQTDNSYYLRSKEVSRKTDQNSASQCAEGVIQNPGHRRHGYALKSYEIPNAARRTQRADDTCSALARDARQGQVPFGYKQAAPFQYPVGGDDFVANDVLRSVSGYRQVLARNVNLNWTPQRIQKHSIKKIDNVALNGNTFLAISNNNNNNNNNSNDNDVYEIALNRLEADDDTEDDDDDGGRNAGFSQRSESPDTLVERILESVDDTGMINDLDEEPAASREKEKHSRMLLQASKKSFSDEILERLENSDQNYSGGSSVRGHRPGFDSRQSRTLEPARKPRSSFDRRKYPQSKDTNSLADRNNTTTTQLNPYLIRQQNVKTFDNIGFDNSYPSLTDPAERPPSSTVSAEAPLLSGTHLTQEPPIFDNRNPCMREPSPEEVFEEIMESIHDTEGDYDEPFFLKWPSLLGRKGEVLKEDRPDNNSIGLVDYSIEDDWLSFFYCNRIANDRTASMAPFSSDGSQSTGIFLNSSLSSSSWIESKPSRSSTLPRTSRPEPSGAATAIFTPNVKHSEAGTMPKNYSRSSNDDPWNDLERGQAVEMERRTRGRIDGEVASEGDQLSLPKVVASQVRNFDYSPGRERLEGEPAGDRLPGGHQVEEDPEENKVQVRQPDATDMLFAALDSACVRNAGPQEARTIIRLDEHTERPPPVKANAGPRTDNLKMNFENSLQQQQHHHHHVKEIARLSESRTPEHLGKCREFLEHSVVDSSDAKAEDPPKESPASESEISRSLARDQEDHPIETTDRTAAVAFIDEEETTFRNALLDTINECDDDDDDEGSKQPKDEEDEGATEPVNEDGRLDLHGSARNFGHVTAVEEEKEENHPDSALQPPPTKRSVQVLSDEVTSQTVVLKIAWPSGKNRERGASRKEQPFRELQLRRTIRMSEPPRTRTAADKSSGNDENDEDFSRKRTSVTSLVVVPQNRNPSDAATAMTSPADVIVEYENREQSRTAETLDEATSVDVTQTDSVRVLLVPADASYQVPDLKEIVAAVGQTILQDSGRIPASSNIRVTCEAIQSKSCAALKEQEDITIINDTIFDTTKSIEDASK